MRLSTQYSIFIPKRIISAIEILYHILISPAPVVLYIPHILFNYPNNHILSLHLIYFSFFYLLHFFFSFYHFFFFFFPSFYFLLFPTTDDSTPLDLPLALSASPHCPNPRRSCRGGTPARARQPWSSSSSAGELFFFLLPAPAVVKPRTHQPAVLDSAQLVGRRLPIATESRADSHLPTAR